MFEVDKDTANRLAEVKESQYICSPDGRILGHYVPLEGTAYVEDFEPRISEEEMQRRLNDEEWFTTKEVLARLKSRERE